MHNDAPAELSAEQAETLIAADPEVEKLQYQRSTIRVATQAMRDAHRDMQILSDADRAAIDHLRATAGDDARLVQVPFLRQDIHDIVHLGMLGRFLVDTDADC